MEWKYQDLVHQAAYEKYKAAREKLGGTFGTSVHLQSKPAEEITEDAEIISVETVIPKQIANDG